MLPVSAGSKTLKDAINAAIRDWVTNVLTATREQLDLRDQAAVNYWFRANRPEYVILAAGTVGGIVANSTRPAEFIYDNMRDSRHRGARRSRVWRDEALISRQLVHLPARGAPAHERR